MLECVDNVFILGDLFDHYKNPEDGEIILGARFIQKLVSIPTVKNVFVLKGNHDWYRLHLWNEITLSPKVQYIHEPTNVFFPAEKLVFTMIPHMRMSESENTLWLQKLFPKQVENVINKIVDVTITTKDTENTAGPWGNKEIISYGDIQEYATTELTPETGNAWDAYMDSNVHSQVLQQHHFLSAKNDAPDRAKKGAGCVLVPFSVPKVVCDWEQLDDKFNNKNLGSPALAHNSATLHNRIQGADNNVENKIIGRSDSYSQDDRNHLEGIDINGEGIDINGEGIDINGEGISLQEALGCQYERVILAHAGFLADMKPEKEFVLDERLFGQDIAFVGHIHMHKKYPNKNIFYVGSAIKNTFGEENAHNGFFIFSKTPNMNKNKSLNSVGSKLRYGNNGGDDDITDFGEHELCGTNNSFAGWQKCKQLKGIVNRIKAVEADPNIGYFANNNLQTKEEKLCSHKELQELLSHKELLSHNESNIGLSKKHNKGALNLAEICKVAEKIWATDCKQEQGTNTEPPMKEQKHFNDIKLKTEAICGVWYPFTVESYQIESTILKTLCFKNFEDFKNNFNKKNKEFKTHTNEFAKTYLRIIFTDTLTNTEREEVKNFSTHIQLVQTEQNNNVIAGNNKQTTTLDLLENLNNPLTTITGVTPIQGVFNDNDKIDNDLTIDNDSTLGQQNTTEQQNNNGEIDKNIKNDNAEMATNINSRNQLLEKIYEEYVSENYPERKEQLSNIFKQNLAGRPISAIAPLV